MEGPDHRSDVLVIRLPSDLSFDRAPELWRALEHALNEGASRLALDMSEVADLSDRSLSAIIKAHVQARVAGGAVRLFAAPRHVTRFLDAMGLKCVFRRFATEEEAVQSFNE